MSDDFKLELYPKRPQEAVFDRIDLVLDFQCGRYGVGAVVKSFLDAISIHDTIVKEVEERIVGIDALKRAYQKKSRLFRNLDSAWNIMLDSPLDFYEYVELIPKVKNIEYRLENIVDSRVRAEVLGEYQRYKALHPVCSKQLIIHDTYSKARAERDEAMKELSAAESELQLLKDRERQAAFRISDDHIAADRQKESLTTMFPNVHG